MDDTKSLTKCVMNIERNRFQTYKYKNVLLLAYKSFILQCSKYSHTVIGNLRWICRCNKVNNVILFKYKNDYNTEMH